MVVRVAPAQAGKTHTDVIRTLLKPTQGRTETTTLNGLQATRFAGARTASNGQSQALEATVITGPGDTIYLLLQTSAKDANALQRARAQVREVEGSFRALTAQDRAAARPWGIKTVAYPKGGFAELAKTSPIARGPEKAATPDQRLLRWWRAQAGAVGQSSGFSLIAINTGAARAISAGARCQFHA